jgi:DNA-binding transcriptional regulator LsrR (DeoR family)
MGKHVPEEIQWIVICLSTTMSREDIAMYTRISSRKIDDILSTFNKYGIVKANTHEKAHTYASLCDEDIQVCPI